MAVFSAIAANIAYYGSVLGAELGFETLGGFAAATAATTSTVASGVSAYTQNRAISEQADAEQRRYTAQQRMDEIRQQNALQRQVQEQRYARAKTIQQSQTAGAGTSGSSGVQGALGSLSTQLASNVSFQQQIGDLGSTVAREDMNIYNTKISNQKLQSTLGAIKERSDSIFNQYGGYKSLFGTA